MDSGEVDAGPYPASHPAPPQVKNTTGNGPTVANGLVVPVFWANDPLETPLETFLGQLSPSSYWTATTKEYGVGDFQLGKSVVISVTPPTTIDDAAIQTWLAAHADGSDPAWPKADPNTVYVLFYPSATTITQGGSSPSCITYGGYHRFTTLADSTQFSYAVIPRCADLDVATGVTSHELVEWATDPFLPSAYFLLDLDHIFWIPPSNGGGEVGDLCASGPMALARLVGNFLVQRTWSNASILAGHDPCVPAPADVYFNAVPDLKVPVSYKTFNQVFSTHGVKIPVGSSKTIDVYLYSDGPTPPWTVSATATTEQSIVTNGALSFSFDKNTGQNGDVLHLNITSVWATSSGTARFTLTSVSSQQNIQHEWLGLVEF